MKIGDFRQRLRGGARQTSGYWILKIVNMVPFQLEGTESGEGTREDAGELVRTVADVSADVLEEMWMLAEEQLEGLFVMGRSGIDIPPDHRVCGSVEVFRTL